MANVNFYSVTPAQYTGLVTKDIGSLYFLTNGQLYKGDMLVSNNVVLIPDGENYPATGATNTFYAKASGECAFWNGSSYTLISRSVMTELEALEDRINETVRLALTSKGIDAVGIIQRTVTEIKSTDVTSVETNAFANCSQLTSVDFPNATYIGGSAFNSCSSLATVNLPKVTYIAGNGFYGCIPLNNVELPKISCIETRAFRNCNSLTKIIIGTEISGTCTLINTDAFSNTPIGSGSGYIYVSDDKVDTYKSASNWSTYSAQIKSVNELS
jgi:hypothetical protein